MAIPNVSLDELDPAALGVPDHLLVVWNRLLNFCEALMAENERLRKELSAVKRELAKLKGQSPKPDIKPNCKDENKSKDRPRRDRRRSSASSGQEQLPRNQRIEIDREQIVRLEDDARPQDFCSTGFRDVVVQNITLKTDNVRYKLERGYSASTGEFHEATLPRGVEPGYGAELQALVLTHYFQLRVPQPKIHQLLTSQGIVISTGQISEIITKKHIEMLGAERTDVLWAQIYPHLELMS